MDKSKKNKTKPVHLKIVGHILSEGYQRCKLYANSLYKSQKKKFFGPVIQGFLEVDWVNYLARIQRNIGGQTWAVKSGVVVFIDDIFIGGKEEFFKHFKNFLYQEPHLERIKQDAKEEYLSYLNRKSLLYTYLELSLDNVYMGTLTFQLRPDLLPQTSARFAILCDPNNRKGVSYKDTKILAVCKSGWFQAGRIELPYDGLLEDESFCYGHDQSGVISFANDGPNSNTCEFFVTFKPSTWMDEYYVAFGRLVEGSDVLRRIEYTDCSYGKPKKTIKIANCGLIEVGLGRELINTARLKLKPITIGDLHIDFYKFFADMMFDRFTKMLQERLAEEVQRQINREWIREMIWDIFNSRLKMRSPVEDVKDIRDKPSDVLLVEHYLAGLYGLRDIPDHYINNMLYDTIARAVELTDIKKIAESVVNFLLNNISYHEKSLSIESNAQTAAEYSLRYLMTNIERIIFGEEDSMLSSAEISQPKNGVHDDMVDVSSGVQESRSDVQSVKFMQKLPSLRDVSSKSSKEDVVQYILDSLFKKINETISV